MGKGTTFAGELLDHIYRNATVPLIGDATGLLGAGTVGSVYAALHTADPGGGGSQNTSESAYTSYARVAIARSGAGFSLSGAALSNAASIDFPACTGGTETATHWSLGTASTGAGKILHSGPLAANGRVFTAEPGDTLYVPGNTLVVDDRVVFFAIPLIALPTGITAGTVYWVKTVSTNTITISTTQGGSTLDITAAGGGRLAQSKQLAISSGITPKIAASVLTITEG